MTFTAIKDGIIYMVSTKLQQIYVLNIDAGTYTTFSTVSGEFQGNPDQIKFLPNSSELFFCEDGVANQAGLFVRDDTNQFYTVLKADEATGPTGETSGIAWSPDKKAMYLSYQEAGKVFQIKRADGEAFDAAKSAPVYHTR